MSTYVLAHTGSLCRINYKDPSRFGGLGIREYGSTLYVGIGQVQYGCLYLRYGSSFVITKANLAKTRTDKKPLLWYC